MLDIAICDDEPAHLSLIASYTSEFLELNQYEGTVHQFLHPDELLRACENKRFDLYILDIVMPMVNGIEVGKTIRNLDRESHIIYASSEPSFALQSFVANPVNYLLKPIDKQQFFATLNLVVSKLDMDMGNSFIVKTLEGIRTLRLSEVVFCEYTKHTAIYTLANGKTVTTRTFKGPFAQHVEQLLQDVRFVKPHASYVVNMDYVESFSKNRFTLRFGYSVPIVTKQYGFVREVYMNYLMETRNS